MEKIEVFGKYRSKEDIEKIFLKAKMLNKENRLLKEALIPQIEEGSL